MILCILKGTSPFKMHKIMLFLENLQTFYVTPVNLGRVWYFLFGLFMTSHPRKFLGH